LDEENNFYHQSTTLFITMKKVMEVEKNMCFELASLEEHSIKQREHLEMGIIKCRENKD
jgi:hypothetical protein